MLSCAYRVCVSCGVAKRTLPSYFCLDLTCPLSLFLSRYAIREHVLDFYKGYAHADEKTSGAKLVVEDAASDRIHRGIRSSCNQMRNMRDDPNQPCTLLRENPLSRSFNSYPWGTLFILKYSLLLLLPIAKRSHPRQQKTKQKDPLKINVNMQKKIVYSNRVFSVRLYVQNFD